MLNPHPAGRFGYAMPNSYARAAQAAWADADAGPAAHAEGQPASSPYWLSSAVRTTASTPPCGEQCAGLGESAELVLMMIGYLLHQRLHRRFILFQRPNVRRDRTSTAASSVAGRPSDHGRGQSLLLYFQADLIVVAACSSCEEIEASAVARIPSARRTPDLIGARSNAQTYRRRVHERVGVIAGETGVV